MVLKEKYMMVGAITLLGKKMKRLGNKTIGRLGLTGTQGRVLCFIFIASQWRDIFQKDLEEEFDIRRSSATGILQQLERCGLIRRVSVPEDARLKKILLTDKALKLQEQVIHEAVEIERVLRSGLSSREVDTFVNLADRMQQAVDLKLSELALGS